MPNLSTAIVVIAILIVGIVFVINLRRHIKDSMDTKSFHDNDCNKHPSSRRGKPREDRDMHIEGGTVLMRRSFIHHLRPRGDQSY